MKGKLSLNPWLTIWTKPRETIRAIVDFNPKYLFFILSWLYGFPTVLQVFQNHSFAPKFSLGWIVASGVILSPFVGMLGIIIFTALILWTGRWIGGKGSFINIRAAVTWSNVPNVFNVVIWIILIGVFKSRLFTQNFSEGVFVGFELSLVFFSLLVQIVLAVWGLIIWLKVVAEVQQFSIWKSVLNVLMTSLLLAVVWILTTTYYQYIN